jgi:hypothetical protein
VASPLNGETLRIDLGPKQRVERHPPPANLHGPLIADFVSALLEGRADCPAWSVVLRILGSEQRQDVFRAVRRPAREQTMARHIEQATPVDGDETWIPTPRVLNHPYMTASVLPSMNMKYKPHQAFFSCNADCPAGGLLPASRTLNDRQAVVTDSDRTWRRARREPRPRW